MKKRSFYILTAALLTTFYSCTKEYSLENGSDTSSLIIGTDCRLSKVDYYDSATNVPLGSIAASINLKDTVTDVTLFDSIGNNIGYNSMPVYSGDTIYIDPDQYFLVDPTTGRISHLHGVLTGSLFPFESDYFYDAGGNLIQKTYDFAGAGVSPALVVDYTYIAGNLTHMTSTDRTISELISDADIDYYSNITPRRYLNLMPDETINSNFNHFSGLTQFFNFGNKPTNAIKTLKVRQYVGNVAVDSTVSNFTGYIMSRDNYVMSVYMLGDDQESIPAAVGKLVFSYKCK